MNITISKKSSTQKKSKLQQRFDKLLREVKNKQKANEKLKLDLAELYKIYQDRVLPVEKLTIIPHSELANRLIDFFSRKSLAKWQRQELSDWIMECIAYVDAIDSDASEKLYQSHRQAIADYMGVDLDEIAQQSEHGEDSLDEIFENDDNPFNESIKPKDSKASGYQEDMFGFSGFEEESEADSSNDFNDFFEEESYTETPNNSGILNDEWLKKIFRRAANALHPDKESDQLKKLEKEKLMSQLLVAREKNDVFSLLNIYTQHVDGDDLHISKDSMKNLCEQITIQKQLLDEEKFKIIYENPIYISIYENLYSKSKKTQDKKIERHLKQINESILDLSQFVSNLRNLKILKAHLESRYDEYRFDYLDENPLGKFY